MSVHRTTTGEPGSGAAATTANSAHGRMTRGGAAASADRRDGLLRFALAADAAITAANGVAYLAGFALLDGWLGVPGGFIAGVGAFLLLFAAYVGRLATRPQIPRAAATAVIAVNVVWAVDSVLLLIADGFGPTLAGQIVIGVQAAGVLGLAALQYAGLRRA